MVKPYFIEINDRMVEIEKGETILEAAKRQGTDIPTLCHMNMKDIGYINKAASCRICMVEVEERGRKSLQPACHTIVKEGMKIWTDTLEAVSARRIVLELLLSDHPNDCLVCEKNMDCELQELAANMGIREIRFKGAMSVHNMDIDNPAIIKNLNKCILCRRCETICGEVQGVSILAAVNRGFDTVIAPAFDYPLVKTSCTYCGQCVAVCPTAALTEKSNVAELWHLLSEANKTIIVQTAPAVRVALGESFNMLPGTLITGKMVAALKQMGFDYVVDTDFAADLTVIEESHELCNRLNNDSSELPLFTSCCPAWVKYLEHHYPDMLGKLSTCKSPHQMLGAVLKQHYSRRLDIAVKDIIVVSVMPCIAKKYESSRSELSFNGAADVDIVITTRELARMIKESGMDFEMLNEMNFDNPFGESSGASLLFAATGGVLESVLRNLEVENPWDESKIIEFSEVRGFSGIKETQIALNGQTIKVAVVHGLTNAKKMLSAIRSGRKKYDAIEVMACKGGCIGGAGQPYHWGDMEVIRKRTVGIYQGDRNSRYRLSKDNPAVQALYADYLSEPGSSAAHELLHTTFIKRK